VKAGLGRALVVISALFISFGPFSYAQDANPDSSTPDQPATVLNSSLSLAVYPLVSSTMPPSGTAGTIDPALIQADINAGIKASPDGPFDITSPENIGKDFDPSVPPLNGFGQSSYSLTSQLFYDRVNQQSQGEIWLYDNSSQTLVVTDQFVFPIVGSDSSITDDASSMAASLLNFILALIPRYTITVEAEQGGTVSLVREDEGKEYPLSGTTVLVQHGSGTVELSASPDLNSQFDSWSINSIDNSYGTSRLFLKLNPQNFPKARDKDDPWGTKVAITVDAKFKAPGSVDSSALDPPPRKGTSARKKPDFSLDLGWTPLLLVKKGDGSYFSQDDETTSYPLDFHLDLNCAVLNTSRGVLNLGINAGWGTSSSSFVSFSDKDDDAGAQYIDASFDAAYRTPLLANSFRVEAKLGGGAVLFFGSKIKQNAVYPLIKAGLGLILPLNSIISLSPGIEGKVLIPTQGSSLIAWIEPQFKMSIEL
jgi:hypothetical protein